MHYDEAVKADLVRQCQVPGISVATRAMAHSINANLLRRWIGQQVATSGCCQSLCECRPLPFYRKRPANTTLTAEQLQSWRHPAMREQLFDQIVFIRRQPRKNVLQISIRIMPIELGALDSAHHSRCPLARAQ